MTASEDLCFLTAWEAASLFRSGELSPVELTEALLARIDKHDGAVRSFITVTPDEALGSARDAERAIRAGDTRPLLGIPIAYKDIIWTAGVRTTGGSRVYEEFIPETNATCVDKLRAAGTVMLGKLTTHEFATRITPEDHPFPPARNPWNAEHIPGGSSSGSGAALAAGFTTLALGTDTGGSIRHPSSASGIAGLKPSFGLCGRSGIFPLSWSMDHVGPMARSARDLALALPAMAGYDPGDLGSVDRAFPDPAEAVLRGVEGVRVGVLRSWYGPRAWPEVSSAVDEAVRVIESLGGHVSEVEVPSIDLASASSVISETEAYVAHGDNLREHRELFPPSIRNRLLTGGLFSGPEYANAQRARAILLRDLSAVLETVDVLVAPTRGGTALTFEQAYEDYMGAVHFCGPFSVTGLPAVSVPCGFSAAGLPIGLQIAGRHFDDATVLRVAAAYEQATDWHRRHPAL